MRFSVCAVWHSAKRFPIYYSTNGIFDGSQIPLIQLDSRCVRAQNEFMKTERTTNCIEQDIKNKENIDGLHIFLSYFADFLDFATPFFCVPMTASGP